VIAPFLEIIKCIPLIYFFFWRNHPHIKTSLISLCFNDLFKR
jgi:hypothetical protein